MPQATQIHSCKRLTTGSSTIHNSGNTQKSPKGVPSLLDALEAIEWALILLRMGAGADIRAWIAWWCALVRTKTQKLEQIKMFQPTGNYAWSSGKEQSSPTSSGMVIERYTQAARTLMDNITAAGVQTSRSSPSVTHRNHIYRSIIKRNTRRTHRVATRSWSHKGNRHPLVETSPESTPPGSQLPGQAWAGQAESCCQRNGETGQLRTSDLQAD